MELFSKVFFDQQEENGGAVEEESVEADFSENKEEETNEDYRSDLHWYTLRVFGDEDKWVKQIKESVYARKLQDRIVDIVSLKELAVIESDEYISNSEHLPKRGFKSTDTCVWAKLHNGNYKKIRLVEKKPFGGMIFIRMEFDLELFKVIRSWDSSFSFLGFPNPAFISDSQMKKTISSLSNEKIDLREYVLQKGYMIAGEDNISLIKKQEKDSSLEIESIKEKEVKKQESKTEEINKKNELEDIESKKAEIYSDLKIKTYENNFSQIRSKNTRSSPKKTEDLKVNDFVLIKHLGFKGMIQEIDFDKDLVVVGVQMFGRKQPVECKISEVTII